MLSVFVRLCVLLFRDAVGVCVDGCYVWCCCELVCVCVVMLCYVLFCCVLV